jgi:hypothetical protein
VVPAVSVSYHHINSFLTVMLQQGAFKFVIKQINSTALSSTWLTREKIEAIENKEDVHKFCITIAIGKKAGDKNYAPKFGKKGKQKSRH